MIHFYCFPFLHSTLDNHMKKQHGIQAPPKQATFARGPRGRPKKPPTSLNMEGGDEAWGGPDTGYPHAQMAPHKELSARPVGQVIINSVLISGSLFFLRCVL
jgi:hypothetical protein